MLQIWLIANQQNLGMRGAGIPYLLKPIAGSILIWLFICDIEHDHEGMRSTVVRTSNGPEFLLPRSVPDLKLHIFIVKQERFKSEVHPDGGEEHIAELVVCVANNNRWLADTRISHKDNFEQI